jgi:murein DD-endopeptidase MepM/ murein hydrolase activator NlpD
MDLIAEIHSTLKTAIIIFSILLAGCSVSKNPLRKEARMLMNGTVKDNTSYVYQLPYETGKSHLLIQGYFGHFSHKERAALDFKMKRGTKVCAAREGIVVRVKQDGDRGGWNKKFRPYGNNIVIQHADGSRAGYWHLRHNGAMINEGDSVKRGQVIGLSGKTGYAALPHLHFLVWRTDGRGWQQILTRFETARGPKYLRSFKRYRNPG